MKRKSLLFLIITFLSTTIYCQDTLQFKLSNPWNTIKDQNGKYLRKCIKEKDYFHVWDFNYRNILVTESFYSDTNFTRKLFCHNYYNEASGLLEQSRCYENGRLHGYFISYTPKGDTLGYDVYENGEVIRSGGSFLQRTETEFPTNEKSASFPGGQNAWREYLNNSLRYPDSLQNIHGEAIVRFKVNTMGVIETIEIIKSLHPLLDQEVVRVLKKSPKWKPAKQAGKKVKSIIIQPITF